MFDRYEILQNFAILNFENARPILMNLFISEILGMIHPGIVGTAPSAELLADWNRRERELISTAPNRNPPFAYPPLVKGTMAGQAEGVLAKKIAEEGARSIPSREHGGNCDIKNLTRGSTIWLPVYVKEANLSFGDIHFSQADGEIAVSRNLHI